MNVFARILPGTGVLPDPYQDPHDVYLMLLRVFDDGLQQLLQLLPASDGRVSDLGCINPTPALWSQTLQQLAVAWFRQHDIELDAALFRSYEKALRYTLQRLGVAEPVVL